MDKEEMIACSCGTHALGVWIDEESTNKRERMVELCFWERGQPRSESWRSRLDHIWRIVKKGTPYSDMLLLSYDEAMKLLSVLREGLL